MKKIIMVMVVVTFCCTMVGIAGAAEAVKPGTGTTMQQVPGTVTPVPVFVCPAGWHKKPNVIMTCMPNKPAPITCPKGYEYFEALSCTLYANTCSGCIVGCTPIPPR